MKRQRPSKRRSIEPPETAYGKDVEDKHEAAESPEFERGEQEGLKEEVAQHLSKDAKEGKKHAAKDKALAKRVRRGK